MQYMRSINDGDDLMYRVTGHVLSAYVILVRRNTHSKLDIH